MNYLLDENVDPDLLAGLKRRAQEMTVRHIGHPGVPARGTLDPEILLWCEATDFILVTNNRKSMPVHLRDHLAAGRHILGIFILHDEMSMGQTIDELELIWGASRPDEYMDQIKHLPISYTLPTA